MPLGLHLPKLQLVVDKLGGGENMHLYPRKL